MQCTSFTFVHDTQLYPFILSELALKDSNESERILMTSKILLKIVSSASLICVYHLLY